ncbi:hypothetical protein PV_031 (endogenous virus) [Gutovirus Vc1]|uniref:Uncharacterized protein n=1 Tax=Vibrio phage Vc1 TaxID=1480731 RepID=X2KPM0_9CAUD|nr:hypothetical protein HOQ97_gp31 [Vibrio phage Vc1]AHN84682.1 hypothetical protein PV_031 [Vibrio phage Vc1]
MTIKVKDKNRAALVQTIIKQNGGKIFTVVAKRKSPKKYFIVEELCDGSALDLKIGEKVYLNTKKNQNALYELLQCPHCKVTQYEEQFMEMTCRTGVKKDLKGGTSTIKNTPDLISVNLTNGKGYRCFSAFNVLELRASGTVIKFKEADVLAFTGE